MAGGVGGDGPGLVALRSTATQMQRGSGELQSTPTGFWKHQSDPAGAEQGSIAAGIGARRSLRSASFTAHMGHSHTWVPTRERGRRLGTTNYSRHNQAKRRRVALLERWCYSGHSVRVRGHNTVKLSFSWLRSIAAAGQVSREYP